MMETKTKTNGHVQRSGSEWQAIVKRFRESGRSRAAFCRAEGISRSTFDVWQRKLKSKTPVDQFVEVTPVVESSIGGWTVEIELPDGTLARLRG
jgi:transposase-like protein